MKTVMFKAGRLGDLISDLNLFLEERGDIKIVDLIALQEKAMRKGELYVPFLSRISGEEGKER